MISIVASPHPSLTWPDVFSRKIWKSNKIFDVLEQLKLGGRIGGRAGLASSRLDTLGLTWTHLVSLGFTWIHLVSLGFALFHLVSLGFTWSHLVSLGFPRFHLNSLGLTWPRVVLPSTTELALSVAASELLALCWGFNGSRRVVAAIR